MILLYEHIYGNLAQNVVNNHISISELCHWILGLGVEMVVFSNRHFHFTFHKGVLKRLIDVTVLQLHKPQITSGIQFLI